MRSLSPGYDILMVVIMVLIAIAISYPFWIRPVRRLINSWKTAVDDAEDDVLESEQNKRFKRRS